MGFSFDSVFGIHEQALTLRAHRAELLASNLTNADTSNYKARDIDFKAVLRGIKPTPRDVSAPVIHNIAQPFPRNLTGRSSCTVRRRSPP